MALKIDRQEGSLSSLDEMRIQVIFQHSDGSSINDISNEHAWVADSISDLPSIGDHVVLNNNVSNSEATPTKNNYKVVSRNIDFSNFSNSDGRIICTLGLDNAGV